MPAMKTVAAADRNSDLARIHIAKKQLGLDDATYRDMLWSIGRVRSAADLDFAGRKRVLEHLRSRGFKFTTSRLTPHASRSEWDWVNNAAGERQPLLRKIAVMLRDSDREKQYVDAMAKRICHVERIEFCTPAQLHDIVSALVYDQKRRAAKAGA